MGYNKSNFKRIREEYRTKCFRAQAIADERKEELYREINGLRELDQRLSGFGLRIMQTAIAQGNTGEGIAKLREENEKITAARAELLRIHGFPADYSDPKYECTKCNDTGYVGIKMCSCMHAAANQKNYTDDLKTKIEKMMTGATDIEAIELDTFNTVVSAVSFTVDGAKYYGFYSTSIGFHQMDVYIVIDENGAIAKVDAKQLIFEEEYFMMFGGMPDGYKEGFVGITGDTWTGDAAVIATATMTTNAMKEAITDAFASFESIK